MAESEAEIGEKEFVVNERLWTIDAPDGMGKSKFAQRLAIKLQEETGVQTRILQPGKFSTERQDLVGRLGGKKTGWGRNSVYLLGMKDSFENLIKPVLESGGMIIEDSSEIRAIAMSILAGENAERSVLKWFREGHLTAGTLPAVRIRMMASVKFCLENLKNRGEDVNLQEMKLLHLAYEKAFRVVKEMFPKQSQWIEVEQKRVDEDSLVSNLDEMAELVIQKTKQK